MAFLNASDAQLWIDEDRAAQLGADNQQTPAAANVAHGAASEKFYAVLRGRRLGVFNSWHEARRSTDRFPHSRHKSFDTHAAATAWFERKTLIATELEASALAERLRDKRLASPVVSAHDFDSASSPRAGVLANLGAASVQLGRGLPSWVSHRITTHDALSQERRRTGSNRDCGSLVSSEPERSVVPSVLDRADGPALHTPQSAPSRASSFRGPTVPSAPATAPPRNLAPATAHTRSLLTSNMSFERRASGTSTDVDALSNVESSVVGAVATPLAPTRLNAQFSTSSTRSSAPLTALGETTGEATDAETRIEPAPEAPGPPNICRMGCGREALDQSRFNINDICCLGYLNGTGHTDWCDAANGIYPDEDATSDDESGDGVNSDHDTSALDAGGIVAEDLGGALGVHRRQSDRRAGAPDTPYSNGGGGAASMFTAQELTMSARLEEREQLRTNAATRTAEAREEATRVAIASNELAASQRVRTNPTAESGTHVFMRVLAADGQMGETRLAKAKFTTQKYFPELKKELRKPVKVFESHKIMFKITNFHLKCLTRVELGGVGGLSPDHCVPLSAVEIEELSWISGDSTLPTPVTMASFTGNVLLWEAQGKALGGLLKLGSIARLLVTSMLLWSSISCT